MSEFEDIVEEAWERHLDSADRSDTKFWFWVAQIAWEREYAAAVGAMPRTTNEANNNSPLSHPILGTVTKL